MRQIKTRIERSRSGLPTMAECGGGMTSTGYAQMVGDKYGQPMKPLFVPKKGKCRGDHAIFVIRNGMTIALSGRGQGSEWVEVYTITQIEGDYATLDPIGMWKNENSDLDEMFNDIVEAGRRKIRIYHCRRAVYYKRQ